MLVPHAYPEPAFFIAGRQLNPVSGNMGEDQNLAACDLERRNDLDGRGARL